MSTSLVLVSQYESRSSDFFAFPSPIQQLSDVTISDADKPKDLLKKMLSVRSVISTTSSFAARNQEAACIDALQYFSEIGNGACGQIFEQNGMTQVAKRAHHGNHDLWNDYLMHKRVEEVFDKLLNKYQFSPANVPRVFRFVSSTNEDWWEANAHRLPKDSRTPANLLFSERIMPLPKVLRESLIDLFCPEHMKEAQRCHPSNKACLVRVYLGKNKDAKTHQNRFFTLRNFQLHLDQMTSLGMYTEAFAWAMADALALMHWRARIDARDVEFVLGSTPIESHYRGLTYTELRAIPPNSDTHTLGSGLTFHKRTIQLWLLDFNQCRAMTMDEVGVDSAVQAFCINDPYYPRPHVDRHLWEEFSVRYVTSSQFLTGDRDLNHLPVMFIQKLEAKLEALAKAAKEAAARASESFE